jgi:anti-sigma B factor antagonist
MSNDDANQSDDVFQITIQGSVCIVVPSPTVENWNWAIIEQAAEIVLEPIRQVENPQVVLDLTGINYFGSVFLALLLRMWKLVVSKNGTMVLGGASSNTRELLAVTALDTIWAIYDTRAEAIAALQSEA